MAENKIKVVGDLNYYGLEMVNRVHSTDGISPTLRANSSTPKIEDNPYEGYRIRMLTPRECWRLQGFSDDAYDKAVAAGMNKTALYAQAGNSIAVPCLMAIFKGLYIDKSFYNTMDITRWGEDETGKS